MWRVAGPCIESCSPLCRVVALGILGLKAWVPDPSDTVSAAGVDWPPVVRRSSLSPVLFGLMVVADDLVDVNLIL